MKKIDLTDSEKLAYWNGPVNVTVRLYFYLQKGLMLLNESRNLFLGIFAAYFALKMKNPFLMVVMFLIAVPVLIAAGWFFVHVMRKRIDFMTTKFSTHYSIRTFDLVKRQTSALEKIVKIIDNTDEKNADRFKDTKNLDNSL